MTKAKTDREPLNLKKMCFPVASSSMLRRIYFKWVESCDSSFDGTRHSYGQYDKKKHIKEFLKEHFKDQFIVWDFCNNDGKVVLEDVIEKLKEDGINIVKST